MTQRNDIRLSLPSKGRLSEDAVEFLAACGIKIHKELGILDQAFINSGDSTKKGSTYIINGLFKNRFKRCQQIFKIKLKLSQEQLKETDTPEKMRFSALQNVTINLPRIGYLAKGKADFFQRLDHLMDLAAQSLTIKRKVINRLMEEA